MLLGARNFDAEIDELTDNYESFIAHPFYHAVRNEMLMLRRFFHDRCADEGLNENETRKFRGAKFAISEVLELPEKVYEERLKDLKELKARHDADDREERSLLESDREPPGTVSYPDPDDD